MSKGLSLLFFVTMVAISNAMEKNLLTEEPIKFPGIALAKSSFVFSVDESLIEFTINGEKVPLPFCDDEPNSWQKVKTLEFYAFDGDIIKITVKDTNYNAGILGTLTLRNVRGQTKEVHTGQGWMCNNKPAGLYGKNGSKAKYQIMREGISQEAVWIWDSKGASVKVSSCTYTIPCF